jgi:2-polyprenyl-3-methyl-5-hydroxy-6-metoxy-1,4-benzoquinol methylase
MNKSERDERWADGEGYNRYIAGELSSFRKDAWKKQICTHFSDRKGLDILDVGAGPGFFSCILSEEGHRLTGIDASEGMLACAREYAEKLKSAGFDRDVELTDREVMGIAIYSFEAESESGYSVKLSCSAGVTGLVISK